MREERWIDVVYFHKVKCGNGLILRLHPPVATCCQQACCPGKMKGGNGREVRGDAGRATESKMASGGKRWPPNEKRRREGRRWKDEMI